MQVWVWGTGEKVQPPFNGLGRGFQTFRDTKVFLKLKFNVEPKYVCKTTRSGV